MAHELPAIGMSASGSGIANHNPDHLIRLLVMLGLAAIAMVIFLTSCGLYQIYTEHVLLDAEKDALRISEVIIAQEHDLLAFDSTSGVFVNDIAAFDTRIKTFLLPFDIVKIKIFDLDGKIVYSTDHNIIGKVIQNNLRLANALTGQVDSRRETKEQVTDLADEQRFNADVIETYLPIRNAPGQIVGCMEFYIDITSYRLAITLGVRNSVALLLLIMLVVFSISFFVIRVGVRQLKTAQRELHRMATIDALTGIYNRGMVLSRAEEELARIVRRDESVQANSLGVIMIDLDHFKQVNDTYGHQVGDQVLQITAQRISECMRAYDIFGRYGGEEFLLVLPESGQKGAQSAAGRVHKAIRTKPFVIGDLSLTVTTNLGVTCTSNPQENFDATLKRADQALYEAKNSGRDKFIWLPPDDCPHTTPDVAAQSCSGTLAAPV